MDWNNLLNTIMPYVVTFVLAILADKYLKTKQQQETVSKLTLFAEDAVLFIEDVAKNNPTVIKGVEKMKMAIAWVKAALQNAGYPVPNDEIIEGKVAAAYQRSDLNNK